MPIVMRKLWNKQQRQELQARYDEIRELGTPR